MVEFLKEVKGNEFTYEKGKRYCSMDDLIEDDLKDNIFVRQPNSPKNRNWWTKFPKSSNEDIFKIVREEEMSINERLEEERLLQL